MIDQPQIVNNLADDLTIKTRLSLLPFIEDPEAEAEAVEAEKQANVKRQQEFFASTSTESGQQNDEPEDGAANGYDAINADEQ